MNSTICIPQLLGSMYFWSWLNQLNRSYKNQSLYVKKLQLFFYFGSWWVVLQCIFSHFWLICGHFWCLGVNRGVTLCDIFAQICPRDLWATGTKKLAYVHKKWACTCYFCKPNFQDFRLKWWRNELFLHCGDELNNLVPSWMSYLTSLNPHLFKNITYIGSFSVQPFLHVFCNSTKSITNSSATDWLA